MADEQTVANQSLPTLPTRRPPSVWPAFVAFVVAVALILVTQFLVGVVIGVWYVATGGDPQRLSAELPEFLASTPVFVTLTLAAELVLLATGIAAARLAPVPRRAGLGLVRPALPAWGYPALVVGSLIPLAAGVGATEAVSLAVPPDKTWERVFGQVTPEGTAPFILFIAFVPGLVEEIFFRGYVQRRLLARWPAWAAIVTAAGLFGLLHISPAQIAFAFVIGLWLGAVAWRSGSVWPACLCHASVNAAAGVWNLGTRFGFVPNPPPVAAVVVGVVLALGCFLASAWLLAGGRSMRPAPSPDESASWARDSCE